MYISICVNLIYSRTDVAFARQFTTSGRERTPIDSFKAGSTPDKLRNAFYPPCCNW